MRIQPRLAAILLLSVFLGACGGGGGAGSSSGSTGTQMPPQGVPRLEMLVGIPPTGEGSMDGYGTDARFRAPSGIAIDAAGIIYIADSQNFTIRRIAVDGLVRTWAGMPGQPGFADGTYIEARFGGTSILDRGIGGIAIDPSGNVLVADRGNHRIRRMTPMAAVSTLAGGGFSVTGDGPALAARFSRPGAIAADRLGNSYVAEAEKGWIRRIAANGDVTTMTGTAEYGAADGPIGVARFGIIGGLAADAVGNVFVADYGNKTIRRVGMDGIVTTVAGQTGITGTADGTGAAASFAAPGALAIGQDGALYVADGRTLRKLASGGHVTTITALNVDVGGLAVAPSGDILATAIGENTVLRITRAGHVAVLAGSRREPQAAADGNAVTARFAGLSAMTLDSGGNLVVIDYDSIRRVAPDGQVTTLAFGIASFGTVGLATDEQGAVYFATWAYCGLRPNPGCVQRSTLRRLGIDGQVSAVMPSASSDGSPLDFRRIGGLTRDRSGNLYITDQEAGRILKLEPSGNLTTVSSALAAPWDITADVAGNLAVWDHATRSVYRIDRNGMPTRLFSPPQSYLQNAVAIAIADDGNIYLADSTHHTVTQLNAAGAMVVTGQRGRQGFEAGYLPGFLDAPLAVAVRGSDLFIAMPTGIAVVRNRP